MLKRIKSILVVSSLACLLASPPLATASAEFLASAQQRRKKPRVRSSEITKSSTVTKVSNDDNGKVSERDQDGLTGPVQQVRSELAKLTATVGQLVEGPRVLLATTTYSLQGGRIHNAYYSVAGSGSLSGREKYRYDSKSRIIEMTRHNDDDSVLSKEVYSYEDDSFGNWTKMIASVAANENGKEHFEPCEITYRTIIYYSNKDIASKDSASKDSARKVAPTTTTTATIAPQSAVQPSTGTADTADNGQTSSGNESNSGSMNGVELDLPTGSAAIPVAEQSYDNPLSSKVVHLPQPVYPTGAGFARIDGKVNVEVSVDKRGEVTKARIASGHPLLHDAALSAARQARFSPLLSAAGQPLQVSGIISYNFSSDAAAVVAPTITTVTTTAVAPPTGTAQAPSAEPVLAAEITTGRSPANATPEATTAPAALAPGGADPIEDTSTTSFVKEAATHHAAGLLHYRAGLYAQAAEALREATRLNPIDPIILNDLGTTYGQLGQHEEAIQAFTEAIRLKADFAQARNNLGSTYYRLGRPREAVESLKQAVSLEPRLAESHYNLVLAYLTLGDRKAAKQHQKIFTDLAPEQAKKLFK